MSKKMIETDRRIFPRVETVLPIKISGDVPAQLINISEEGMCFSTDSPLSKRECSLSVNFFPKPVDIITQLRWSKKIGTGEKIMYGSLIKSMDKNVLKVIRQYMFSEHFRIVMEEITHKQIKKDILAWGEHFREYLFGLIKLNDALIVGNIEKREIQNRIISFNHDIVRKGEKLKQKIENSQLLNRIKILFRTLVGCWVFESKVIRRGFQKPKEYPGDYEILEMIYNKVASSPDNKLGHYFDIYFINTPYARAVRKKKDKLREIIEKVIVEKKESIKILNLGCGSCREIRELCGQNYKTIKNKQVFFYCLDWDKNALEFSKKQLSRVPNNIQMKFIDDNVLSFVEETDFYNKEGTQDLIYSASLANCFSDETLKAMIKSSFEGLKKNGKFIIMHKNKDMSFSHLLPEWFCNWNFYQRDERGFLNIINAAELENVKLEVDKDESENISSYILTRQMRENCVGKMAERMNGLKRERKIDFTLGLGAVETSFLTKIKLYKKRIQEIENYLFKNPEEWGKFQSEFNSEVDGIFNDIMNFEKINLLAGYEEKVHKLKRLFVKRIRKLFVRGKYIEWSLYKPFGYAGDFKIIDDIYQNTPITNGVDRLFDNYYQMSSICSAVRNRKNEVKRWLTCFINERQNIPLRIMNLASGSCREIKELLLSDSLLNKDIIFDCYEQESRAINFAKNLLAGYENVNFIKENALKLSCTKKITSRIDKKYALIYVLGLFDYFNYDFSVKLVKNLKKLLLPEGTLFIANVCNKYSNSSVHFMEWVGDWNLLYRDGENFKNIFIDAGFKESELKLQHEQQGIMQYIIATSTKGQ